MTRNHVKENTLFIAIALAKKTVIVEISPESDEKTNTQYNLKIRLSKKDQVEEIEEILKKFPLGTVSLLKLREILTYSIYYEHDVDINLESFLLVVMTNGLFARYLKIIETGSTPNQNFVKMEYAFPFPSDALSFIFRVSGNQIGKKHLSNRSTESEISQEIGTAFLEIRVETESDEDMIPYVEFIALPFQNYLKSYQNQAEAFLGIYLEDKPHVALMKAKNSTRSRSQTTTTSMAPSRKGANTRRSSNRKFDDFFMKGEKSSIKYMKKNSLYLPILSNASCLKQPEIIKPELVEEFQRQTFTVGNETYYQIALPFPSIDNPTVHLGCPRGQTPFIGIKYGKSHNLIPCCYEEDQNVPGKALYKYLKGESLATVKEFNVSPLGNTGILESGRHGKIPIILEQLLQKFQPKKQFTKIGVPLSKSSFLHAVLLGINDPDYAGILIRGKDLNKENILEQKIVDIRKNISEKLSEADYALIVESAFTLSFEEIKEQIQNEKIYFDPRIYLRLIQKIYQYRILLIEVKDEQISVSLPYGAMFTGSFPLSVEQFPLLVLLGQASKDSKNIQWEPIITIEKEGTSFKIVPSFSSDYGDEVAKFLIEKIPQDQVTVGDNDIIFRQNELFNQFAFINLFSGKGWKIISQTVDAFGKCQCVIFERKDQQFRLKIPPVSPFDVKIVNTSVLNKTPDVVPSLIRLFGAPRVIFENGAGDVWKIQWFSIHFPIEFYLKPQPIEFEGEIKKIVMEVESLKKLTIFEDAVFLRREANRLQNLCVFVFVRWAQSQDQIAIEEENIESNLEKWKEMIEINPEVEYDFSSLFGIYPEDIEALEKTGLYTEDKIILPSEIVRDRILIYLKQWLKNRLYTTFDSLDFGLIPKFYRFPSDFVEYPDARIYKSSLYPATEVYLQERRNSDVTASKIRKIKGPYHFVSLIFQTGDQEEAEIRAQNWKIAKINSPLPFEGSVPNPKITIFTLESLTETIGKTPGEDVGLFILQERIPSRGAVRVQYSVILPLGII